ncbi:NAD(+)/NADH kinase [Methanococcoides burtonii]|uniref:NAD kinase n=1 Tax=Methanococcoides burtonii (strain DSM 6242 / NBRC 107633 / OCM 468 / ACE-M) TaxID=259564 RepID=Q12XM2_METBU|nr:NAD(+)/NADH kinase [Methanococcoides burtonii]ABE51804.1 NAD Kinase [Methanococcoides burtonii DSM 6242]
MAIKKIGIVSRCDHTDALEMVSSIVDNFGSKVKVALSPNTALPLKLEGVEVIPVELMREHGVELLISVGGDGTVLRNIARMEDPLPILGINMGTVGFLVEVNPSEAISTIEKVLEGFKYSERSRLAIDLNGESIPAATNEVVLTTARPAKILTFRITIDDQKAEEMRADGVVIATPTGSTAYAMSAGGPLIDPAVNATLIVPLAPFKLSARPWVVPASSIIKVEMIVPEKEAALVVDGQYTHTIQKSDVVTLTMSGMPARFVEISASGFYERVQNKLR